MELKYLKVGRLYPGENGLIHIIRDGTGEIGTKMIKDVKKIISGGDILF